MNGRATLGWGGPCRPERRDRPTYRRRDPAASARCWRGTSGRCRVRRVIPLLIGTVLYLSACADKPYERIVVIDPGYGGVDPGAIGSTSNILEKEVGSIGSASCRSSKPQKYCQYGFSTQRSTTAWSDRAKGVLQVAEPDHQPEGMSRS
jgi:hypothetical protein